MEPVYIEIAVKYIHFISIFGIIGAVVGESLLLKKSMTRSEIRRMSKLDGLYGLCSITLLAAGMTLWFGVGKPAEFYSTNWAFLLKLGLFVVVGLLSIYPTVYFMRQRKGDQAEVVPIPGKIKTMIRLELVILFLIPVLSSIMARGL